MIITGVSLSEKNERERPGPFGTIIVAYHSMIMSFYSAAIQAKKAKKEIKSSYKYTNSRQHRRTRRRRRKIYNNAEFAILAFNSTEEEWQRWQQQQQPRFETLTNSNTTNSTITYYNICSTSLLAYARIPLRAFKCVWCVLRFAFARLCRYNYIL